MALASPEAHARGRKAIAAAWVVVTGAEATLPELQIAGAQAHLESGYGRGPYHNKLTGESRVLNNWGAQQCGHGPPCGADCFEVSDTHEDGTPYNFCYAMFPETPEGDARAAEFYVKAITLRRPSSWQHMKRGDIDAWTLQMRAKDPITKVGVYFEQPYEARAHGIELRVNEIASAFGEPVVATRGGPAVPDGGDAGAAGTPAGDLEADGGPSPLAAGLIGLAIGVAVFVGRILLGGGLR